MDSPFTADNPVLCRGIGSISDFSAVDKGWTREALTGPDERSPAYLAHELMGAAWEPLSVMTVRADLASIGLLPVGSAMLVENHDAFVLGRAARTQLQAIKDPDVREFARDFFISQSFRRDVFTLGGRRLTDAERHDGLMDRAWWLSRQSAPMEYWVQTPAGKLNFDNPAARHIVKSLAAGPRRLNELSNNSVAGADLIANALVLSAAGVIWPVEGGDANVDLINGALADPGSEAIAPSYTALPFGTAVRSAAKLTPDPGALPEQLGEESHEYDVACPCEPAHDGSVASFRPT